LFDWRSTDFRPTVHEFKSDGAGISVNIEKDSSVLDFFQLFFTLPVMQHITQETNKYHEFLTQNAQVSTSRLQTWKDTSPDELYLSLQL
jgi:hypothetical protein